MKVLLDTCTFLWIIADPSKLSTTAVTHFQDASNTCYLSSVSTWEISVLVALGRLQFKDPIDLFLPRIRRRHGIKPLRLFESATLMAAKLPMHHRDPFDRMLICQALAHGFVLLTPDPEIAKYSATVIW